MGIVAGANRPYWLDQGQYSPGAPAAPSSFWDAARAGYDDATQVHNLGAREEAWRTALWQRDQDIQKRTGVSLAPSITMLSQPGAGAGMGAGDIGQSALAGVKFQADDAYEAAIDKLRAEKPGAMAGVPTLAQLRQQTADHLSQVALHAAQAAQQHPVGGFIGGAAGGMLDPVQATVLSTTGGIGELENLGAIGLRQAAGQVLQRAALQGGVQALTAAGEAPLKGMEAADVGGPSYGLPEAEGDIAGAGLGGFLLEGGLGGLRIAGGRLKLGGLVGDPAARGAAEGLDSVARDEAAVGPNRDGSDYDAGLASLQTQGDVPDIEPREDFENIFQNHPADRPISGVELTDGSVGGQPGDLPQTGGAQLYDRADYRGRPIYAASFDPGDLSTAPDVFQYKSGGDAEGVTARLKGVKLWDPVSSGKTMVWQDADGGMYVADGHQRLGLAKRLASTGFEPKLDGYLFRAGDGWTAGEVRLLAAMKNIREGQGSPLDAAKVFRQAPAALNDDSLPLSGEFIAQARGLARLSNDAFGAVANGVIPERWGAAIGELAGDRPDLHGDMVGLLKAGEPANLDEARAMIQEARQEDWLQHEPDQLDMFGGAPRQSVIIAKARVNAAVLRALRADERAFGQVVRNADALEAGGNTLARDANEANLALNRAALEIISKLGTRSGEIGDALTEAAKAVMAGEKPGEAARGIVARVKNALAAGERLDGVRHATLDPPAPPEAGVKALQAFDEPGGPGQAAQLAAKPEEAHLETVADVRQDEGADALPAGLFPDLEAQGDHQTALDRLRPCAPGG